jgi:hypothetical protein
VSELVGVVVVVGLAELGTDLYQSIRSQSHRTKAHVSGDGSFISVGEWLLSDCKVKHKWHAVCVCCDVDEAALLVGK